MRMLYVLLLACAVAGVPGTAAAGAAQDDTLEQRLERVAGIGADAASTFFEDLRRHLGAGDRRAACAMVAYPLRHPDGDVLDAAACEARYDSIFTVPVRRAVGRQQWKELFVTSDGVAVGIGELWFAGRCRQRPCAAPDLRITTIITTPGLLPPKGKVLIACGLGGQAVSVTADGIGGAELRMWRSAAATGPPGVEVLRGTPTAEAAGLCAWRAWSFADGTSNYTVAEVGCLPAIVPAPWGTVARVTQQTPGAQDDGAWCYE